MSDRYWIGGNGTWDGSSTTHWSLTTGGSSGASVPSSSDNVFFDSSSGSPSVTVGATVNMLDLNISAAATIDIRSRAINIFGSLNITSGFNNGGSRVHFTSDSATNNSLNFKGSGSGYIVKTSGQIIDAFINFQLGATSDITFQDDWLFNGGSNSTYLSGGNMTITSGVVNFGSHEIDFGIGGLAQSGGTLDITNSTILMRVGGGTSIGSTFNAINFTGGTFISTGSIMNFAMTANSTTGSFPIVKLGGQTFGAINITATGSKKIQFSDGGTISSIVIGIGVTVLWETGKTFNIGAGLANGTSGSHIIMQSTTATPAILNSSGMSLSFLDPTNLTATGSTFYDPNGTDGGGNTNWNFGSSPAVDSSKHRGFILTKLFGG